MELRIVIVYHSLYMIKSMFTIRGGFTVEEMVNPNESN